MNKGKLKNPLVSHSWGILLGMAVIPVDVLMAKLFPVYGTAWIVVAALAAMLVVRSLIGFLLSAPAAAASSKQ